MTKFNEIPYERIDFAEFEKKARSLEKIIQTSTNVEEAVQAVLEFEKLDAHMDTMYNIAYIKFSIDMNDATNKAEDSYWSEFAPKFSNVVSGVMTSILHAPTVEGLKKEFPETFFLLASYAERLNDERLIPLQVEENKLCTQYNELIGSAQIPFNGKDHTIPEMTIYTKSDDRNIRKGGSLATSEWFAKNSAKFDEIYDQLVKNRHQQAQLLGFDTYVEMSYYVRSRFGYGQKEVATYRKQILEEVVPLSKRMYEAQAERIGVDELLNYDLNYEFATGSADPYGTTEEKVAVAQKMYQELSKETGEFFDMMVQRDLLDLDSKKGKQSGGYCTSLLDENAPFIFANYNGTSGDVDVLTHEAGHAFQVYSSNNVPLRSFLIWPTIEAAEIFSMSMEFITWPWMEGFFKEKTEKYKYSHLLSGIHFLPYGVLVDHYQHEVYANPDKDAAWRKATWRKLEKMYCPMKNYSEDPFLEEGIFWYRQGHVFEAPFYYIDYTLAQIVAFQNWKKFRVDNDPNAWEDYHRAAQLGGTKTFTQIVEAMNLRSPFEEGALEETVRAISSYLDQIDVTSF